MGFTLKPPSVEVYPSVVALPRISNSPLELPLFSRWKTKLIGAPLCGSPNAQEKLTNRRYVLRCCWSVAQRKTNIPKSGACLGTSVARGGGGRPPPPHNILLEVWWYSSKFVGTCKPTSMPLVQPNIDIVVLEYENAKKCLSSLAPLPRIYIDFLNVSVLPTYCRLYIIAPYHK